MVLGHRGATCHHSSSKASVLPAPRALEIKEATAPKQPWQRWELPEAGRARNKGQELACLWESWNVHRGLAHLQPR